MPKCLSTQFILEPDLSVLGSQIWEHATKTLPYLKEEQRGIFMEVVNGVLASQGDTKKRIRRIKIYNGIGLKILVSSFFLKTTLKYLV